MKVICLLCAILNDGSFFIYTYVLSQLSLLLSLCNKHHSVDGIESDNYSNSDDFEINEELSLTNNTDGDMFETQDVEVGYGSTHGLLTQFGADENVSESDDDDDDDDDGDDDQSNQNVFISDKSVIDLASSNEMDDSDESLQEHANFKEVKSKKNHVEEQENIEELESSSEGSADDCSMIEGSEVGSEAFEEIRNEKCATESMENDVVYYSNTSQEQKNSQIERDDIEQLDHTKQNKFEPTDGLDHLSGTTKDLNGARVSNNYLSHEGKKLDNSKSSNDSWKKESDEIKELENHLEGNTIEPAVDNETTHLLSNTNFADVTSSNKMDDTNETLHKHINCEEAKNMKNYVEEQENIDKLESSSQGSSDKCSMIEGSEVGSETLEDARNNAERIKRVLESTTNEVCTIESV